LVAKLKALFHKDSLLPSRLFFLTPGTDSALEGFFAQHAVLTPAGVREIFGLSRKYIIPLLEYFDGRKFTVRTPEGGRMLISGRSR